jgi:hypothetical protein
MRCAGNVMISIRFDASAREAARAACRRAHGIIARKTCSAPSPTVR